MDPDTLLMGGAYNPYYKKCAFSFFMREVDLLAPYIRTFTPTSYISGMVAEGLGISEGNSVWRH